MELMNFKKILKKVVVDTFRMPSKSEKSWFKTFLLCLFLGGIGAHRFYTGHTLLGVVYFLTFGLFGFGWFFDFVTLIFGNYYDSDGKYVGTYSDYD